MNQRQACIDGLLWIGHGPGTYETVHQFVIEAQLRGCCRQLPYVPGWVVFGKSKIFLAHRDGHRPSRGSLFGYFVLHRIEIITKDAIAWSLKAKRRADSLWPVDVSPYIDRATQCWRQKLSWPEIRRRLRREFQQRHAQDLARGRTGMRPRRWPFERELEKAIREAIQKVIEKALEDFVKDWVDRHTQKCFPSRESTRAEGERMCSFRKGPGAIYAVDALCAAIYHTYTQRLQAYIARESKTSSASGHNLVEHLRREMSATWREWLRRKRSHRWKAKHMLAQYEGPFREAVESFLRKGWRAKYRLDRRLRGKAVQYGELVVFNRPFPVFDRAPQAAFRGILRVEGDSLIKQIANHRGKKRLVVKIPYCDC
jgi:hypothetical protein